jgi:hypothetical protein
MTWLLSIGLGVLLGFWGRGLILDQYRLFPGFSWMTLIFPALVMGILTVRMLKRNVRNKGKQFGVKERREAEVSKLYWPLANKEPLISEDIDLPVEEAEGVLRVSNSQISISAEPTMFSLDMEADDRLEQNPRKVRLRRILTTGNEEPRSPIVGIELSPPEEGKAYFLFTDGGVFSTSTLTFVSPTYIKTRNSFFSVDVLETAGPLAGQQSAVV